MHFFKLPLFQAGPNQTPRSQIRAAGCSSIFGWSSVPFNTSNREPIWEPTVLLTRGLWFNHVAWWLRWQRLCQYTCTWKLNIQIIQSNTRRNWIQGCYVHALSAPVFRQQQSCVSVVGREPQVQVWFMTWWVTRRAFQWAFCIQHQQESPRIQTLWRGHELLCK